MDVNVRVHKKASRDKVIYTYQLENNSQHSIVVFRIGYNFRDEAPELPESPIGWTLSEGLAQDSTTAPHGWTATLITTEETPFVEIEWRSTDKTQWSIAPGTTSMDFSVVLPQEVPEYERAHFDVVFSNSTRASARMVPENPPVVLRAQPLSARTHSGQTVALDLLAGTSEVEEISSLQADAKTSGVGCLGCSSSAGIEGWQLLVLLASSRFIRRRHPLSRRGCPGGEGVKESVRRDPA
jgi:hypothetical protein